MSTTRACWMKSLTTVLENSSLNVVKITSGSPWMHQVCTFSLVLRFAFKAYIVLMSLRHVSFQNIAKSQRSRWPPNTTMEPYRAPATLMDHWVSSARSLAANVNASRMWLVRGARSVRPVFMAFQTASHVTVRRRQYVTMSLESASVRQGLQAPSVIRANLWPMDLTRSSGVRSVYFQFYKMKTTHTLWVFSHLLSLACKFMVFGR